MANIQERRDKSGKLISYSIRVHRGRGMDGKQLKPWTATFEVSPTWTEKSARKKAEAFAATFEKQCKEGTATDSRLKLGEYLLYVIDLKERSGAKHTTITYYKALADRIVPALGHLRLVDLRPDHLNSFYHTLSQPEQNKRTGGGLSSKSILEHHRLIRLALEQAVKEGILPYNTADRATPPSRVKKEIDYFGPEEIAAIVSALDTESLRWKMLINLMLVTGCRRGEILGLKWDKVDFEKNQIYICNNLLYRSDIGIYEDTPKTARSIRYIALPEDTMLLFRRYRAWQTEERLRLGEYYQNQNFVFSQDNGKPLHPDSVTAFLTKFSKRHGLPHIHAHSFRHTAATLLLYNGVDIATVAKRLGHSQVSTTLDVYSHVLEKADRESADILGAIITGNVKKKA